MKKTWLLWSLLLMAGGVANAQLADTAAVNQLYDYAYLLPENKADSVALYAEQIAAFSAKARYGRGLAYASRLKGIAAEYAEDTRGAIRYYLAFQQHAEEIRDTMLIASALSDAAAIYAKLQQYEAARQNYLTYIGLLKATTGNRQKLAKGYSNLGVIYRRENKLDSAGYWYRQALGIRTALADSAGMATVQNNLASLLLYQEKPDEALRYIAANLAYHRRLAQTEDLWFDYCNLASVYMQKASWNAAMLYGDTALQIAQKLASKSKEVDTYEVLKTLYHSKGDDAKAYYWQEKEIALRSEIINAENNAAITTLREQYEAQKREQENRLLAARLQNEQLTSRSYLLGMAGVLLVALLAALAWWQARQRRRSAEAQHQFVQKQNAMLAKLNTEKNALIQIVSHDLGTPLAQIDTWQQVLANSPHELDDNGKMALAKIAQAAQHGQLLVERVLSIEAMEQQREPLQLEMAQIGKFIEHLLQPFETAAAAKQQTLEQLIDTHLEALTDLQVLQRIVSNLVSNAIKYSPVGAHITVEVKSLSEKGWLLMVQDNGPGIDEDQLQHLFTPYASIGNNPTGGEKSHGLGLSIVKRLADELGAQLSVRTERDKGAAFTIHFS